MKKNYRIQVPVSKEEKKKIERKAKACGMNLATYLRHLGLMITPREVKKLESV